MSTRFKIQGEFLLFFWGRKSKNFHLVINCLLPWENPHHPARALGQEPPTIEVLGMIFFFLSKYDVKDFKITFEKIKKMVKKVHLNDIALAIVLSIPFTITRTEDMKDCQINAINCPNVKYLFSRAWDWIFSIKALLLTLIFPSSHT